MKPLLLLASLLATTAFAGPQKVHVEVNGMVCSFCAQGVKKKFGAEAAVEQIDVDLDKHTVDLTLKAPNALNDDRIREIITSNGLSVTAISREEK